MLDYNIILLVSFFYNTICFISVTRMALAEVVEDGSELAGCTTILSIGDWGGVGLVVLLVGRRPRREQK